MNRSLSIACRHLRHHLALLTLLVILPITCKQQNQDNSATSLPIENPSTATPNPDDVIVPPGADNIGITFFKAWEVGDYTTMYSLLSPQSQALVDAEAFSGRYQEALTAAHVIQVRTQPIAAHQNGAETDFTVRVIWDSPVVGEISREHLVRIVYQSERWGILWDESMILPELTGGNRLVMSYQTPARANIYDHAGNALAYQGTAIALGIVPGLIQDETGLLNALSTILGRSTEDISAEYAFALPDWYVPIGEISSDTMLANIALLQPHFGAGLVTDERLSRIYPEGTIAPHLIGYVTNVPGDNYESYWELGYQTTDRVGRVGMEAWGESYLAGTRGGILSALDTNGNVVTVVQQREPKQARAIYATFEKDFQKAVEDALSSALIAKSSAQAGAAVVINVNTGQILAMATYPTYDAGIFDPKRPDFNQALEQILNDTTRPLINRAAQGRYPPGSVFKIVTLSAGLLSGQYGFDSRYTSIGTWDKIGENFVKRDWKDGGHGNISYQQALVESCNSCFYEMAFRLDETDSFFFPNIARQFGFGTFMDIGGLPASGADAGIIPDPEWKIENIGGGWVPGDAVNMGIGQGFIVATPLQIANMMAALANGGTIYQPTLVDRIGGGGGAPEEQLPPNVIGQLPIGIDQIEGIRQALRLVTTAQNGTAIETFGDMVVPIAGKTGTAENPAGQAHAWFASFAPSAPYTKPDGTIIDQPEIAVVAIAENAGDGSAVAAPIVRRITELYYGIPVTPYPWER